jgi:hypothetical protein
MGAHNSVFVRSGDQVNNVAGNQYYDAIAALDAGLRLLQVQVHIEPTGLRMCHSSCSLYDAGLLSGWLGEIANWVGDHANDVVTLLLVNSDNAETSAFAAAYQQAGLDKYGYAPSTTNATSTWPTLQEMITANTRVVSFVTNINSDTTYGYLIPEFNYVFETAYEVTSTSGFNSTLDRPSRIGTATEAITAGYMGLVNHMLGQTLTSSIYVPDVNAIETTNSNNLLIASTLGAHVATCISEWGVKPQFVLVDFWDKGNVMAVADSVNGLLSAEVSGRLSPSSGDKSDAKAQTSGHVLVWGLVLVAGFMMAC